MIKSVHLTTAMIMFCIITALTACKDRGASEPVSTAISSERAGHVEHSDHDDHSGDAEAEGEHEDEIKLSADAVRGAALRVEKARTHMLVETLVAPARISFNIEAVAHVGSPLSGRVAEIKARVGQEVKRGDVLLTVDSPDLGEAQSDFLQKRTAIAAAEHAATMARASYERAKKLFEESGGIALNEVQKREADFKAAQGGLAASGASATAAENRLHLLGMTHDAIHALAESSEINPRFAISAPIAGKVVHREVTLGELISPEREALLVLADTSSLWVLADVPEARISGVRIGSKALVAATARDGEPIEGVVTQVAASVDATKRTAEVRIEIAGAHPDLKPGMFAQARISLKPTKDGGVTARLAVPQEAIQIVKGSPVVFVPVAGEANTFTKRAVKVSRPVGRLVPILGGLKEGDEVVVAGSFILKADLGKAGASHEH